MKNKLLQRSLVIAAVLFCTAAYSQDKEPVNFLQNGSFEAVKNEKLKKPENLDDLVFGWESPTLTKADFYTSKTKSELLSIPENQYGNQSAAQGSNYAGFRAYTKDSKKNRTYVGRLLMRAMTKDKTYCIKMQVSLADLSKYAVNNIGVWVTKKKFQQGDSKSLIQPDFQIMNTLNPVIQDREGWTTICGTYVAKGGEEAIVIGCFEEDANLTVEKLKKPKGFTQPQSLDAYYYLDNVEVKEVVASSQCGCGGDVKDEIIYSPPFVNFDDLTDEEKIANSTVYFAQESAKINSVAKRDLKSLLAYLKENPQVQLTLTGHMDLNEFDESKITTKLANIGAQRAEALKNYFVSQGLNESRFTTVDKAASMPLSKFKTPLQLAKNRRVEFTLR